MFIPCRSNIWLNTSKSNISRLQTIQNFAAQIATGMRKYDHITTVLKELKWLPVATQLQFRNAIMAFNYLTSRAPEYLSSQLIKWGEISARATRSSQFLCWTFYFSSLLVVRGHCIIKHSVSGTPWIAILKLLNQYLPLSSIWNINWSRILYIPKFLSCHFNFSVNIFVKVFISTSF